MSYKKLDTEGTDVENAIKSRVVRLRQRLLMWTG